MSIPIIAPSGGFTGPVPGMPILDDAGIASGMAFLVGELERNTGEVVEPLTSVTWQRDIYPEYGAGFVDYTSFQTINYATSGTNQYGIVAGKTTDIPIIQANLEKEIFPVQTWANIIQVGWFDLQRMQYVNRSLDEMYFDGLQMNWNKTVDANTYVGFPEYGQTGLLNDPRVTTQFAAAVGDENGATDSTLWLNKNPDQILDDLNGLLYRAYAASGYDPTALPNQLLVDPFNFGLLVGRKVSSAGNISILEYLKQNNFAKAKGIDLQIVDCRWCEQAGLPLTSGGSNSNRVVAYVNDRKKVTLDIPIPPGRVMTESSVKDVAYNSLYVAKLGVVKFRYTTCVQYLDGV